MPDENNKTTLAERMKAKQGLGRSKHLPKVFMVKLDQLRPNPKQPRKNFDDIALQELANSITRHGLLNPITVMEDFEVVGNYIIATGERRFRAHELLGRDEIPAILLMEGDLAELGLIENLQRENLDPFEEAEALRNMLNQYGYSQDDLAQAVGRNKVAISESLSINSLPEVVRKEAQGNPKITRSFLIELARVEDQEDVWDTYKKHGMTVRDIRALKNAENAGGRKSSDVRTAPKTNKARPLATLVLSHAKALRERLSQAQQEQLQFSPEDLQILKDAYGKLTAVITEAETSSSDVRTEEVKD